MSELLKTFLIDSWYKALLVISTGLFVLALMFPLQVPNGIVLLGSLGAALFGLGQWINHPYQARLVYPYKITGHPRRPSVGGVVLEIAGVGLMGLAAWKIAWL